MLLAYSFPQHISLRLVFDQQNSSSLCHPFGIAPAIKAFCSCNAIHWCSFFFFNQNPCALSGPAFSLIGRETILMICCLLISCHISTRLPTRSWSENRMVQTKRVFARTSFLCVSWSPDEFQSVIILWRQSVVQVKMFSSCSLSGFLYYKGVGMCENCLQNENGDIFPRSTLG